MSGSELNSTDVQNLEMTDEWTIFKIGEFAFLSINGPLIVLNLMANIFFVFSFDDSRTGEAALKDAAGIHGFLYNTIFTICYFDVLCVELGQTLCLDNSFFLLWIS